jgi:hypothetical protein
MERYLGDLLGGPLPKEIERRFGTTEKPNDSRKTSAGDKV